MAMTGKICAFVVLVVLSYAVPSHADMHLMMNYASIKDGENFELKWTYKNGTLHFKMKCKGLGWCAVGFSTAADGSGMNQYDIAVGGVASNMGYIDDYWSTTTSTPTKDPNQNLTLANATEFGGYTMVEFYKLAMSGNTGRDVQFMSNTEVWVMWGLHDTQDADAGIAGKKHTFKNRTTSKHNLIMEAMNAGMNTEMPTMSMTMTMPSVTTPKATPTSAASQTGLRSIVVFAILSLASCVLFTY